MDRIVRGFSAATGVRASYADVTETASELERRHLSGPAAGLVLGRALAATALLWPNLAESDETVSIRLRSDGPVGGFLVEVNAGGDLRGYTYQKILPGLDGEENLDLPRVLGATGSVTVVHSSSTRVLGSAHLEATSPSIRVNLARYFNQSLQIPTGVELVTSSKDGFLRRSVGLVLQRMPGTDQDAFLRALQRCHDGTTRKFLESSEGVEDFRDLFDIADLTSVESHPLRFRCRCSYARTLDVISTLPIEEIREIAATGESRRVTCHFCGEVYAVSHRDLLDILEHKCRKSPPRDAPRSDRGDTR